LQDFSRPRATGVNAITINEGDQLLEARMTDGNSEVMMAVKSGRAIRFPEEKVRPTGRGAIGVGGIEVDDTKDEVIGMICVSREDKSKTILVISEKGLGKRSGVDEYRITNRGGKGVKTINVTEKTGSLIGFMAVEESEDLIITCKSGITLRTPIANIKEAGRATQGVKLIRVDEDDEIAAISKINEAEAVGEDILLDENGEPIVVIANETAPNVNEEKAQESETETGEEPVVE
jgi:DNA gyrase subunit A